MCPPVDLEMTNGVHQRRNLQLRVLQDINGYSVVFIPDPVSSLLLKSASSLPHIIELKSSGIRSLSGLSNHECQQGFVFADERVRGDGQS